MNAANTVELNSGADRALHATLALQRAASGHRPSPVQRVACVKASYVYE